MSRQRWTVRKLPGVEEFISALPRVARTQIEMDIEKLESRGTRAAEPLVSHLEGDVYYLRIKAEPSGIFRIFYFRDGEYSFVAFDALHKKSDRIPGHVRKRVLKRYQELKGGKR